MTSMLTYASVAILLGWAAYALAWLFQPFPVALLAGVLVGVLSIALFRDTIAIRGFIALFGPIGIVLPMLALRHVAIGAGLPVAPFATIELLAFLVLYVLFIVSSMGLLPFEIYRLGYAPVPVAILVLSLCAYGWVTGNVFVPLVAVVGQALWVLGWGSSNWFDHVLHAMLAKIVILVLLLRIF